MKFFNLLCVFTLVAHSIAEPCVKDELDIAFMVDTSFSGDANYAANVGSFVRNSVEHFYTGDQYLKVAVFKYGAIFDSSGFTPDLNNANLNFQSTSSPFNLLGAIQNGISKFSQLNGARLSSSKFLIVVTGAMLSDDFRNVNLQGFQAQQVTVIIVGVGHPSFGVGLQSIPHSDGVVVLTSSAELATSTALANKFEAWYPCGFCSSATVCNGGYCAKGLCECPSGYSGQYCTLHPPAVEECKSDPCKSPCKCVASCRHEKGYYCVGPDGHLGKDCQIAPPQLHCQGSAISIAIPQEFVRDQATSNDQMYLYMSQHEVPYSSTGDQSCRVSTLTSGSYYSLSIPVPFTECGTTKSYSAEGVIGFSNIVWLNHYGTTTHDIPVPVVEFTCYYNGSYQVLSTIRPVVDDVHVDLEDDLSTGIATVELCKITASCLSSCPPLYSVTGGAIYTIAQYINLRFTTHNDHQQETDLSSIKVVILDLFLTCDRNSDTDDKIPVIVDGCPATGYPTRIHFNGRAEFVCVSFKVPRISDCQNIFYIHAKLVQMHIDDIKALKQCTGVHDRRKRSIHSDGRQIIANETKHISIHNIGPIYVLEEKEGRAETEVFPDADVILLPGSTKVGEKPSVYHAALVTSCIVLGIFVATLLFTAIFWKLRYSK